LFLVLGFVVVWVFSLDGARLRNGFHLAKKTPKTKNPKKTKNLRFWVHFCFFLLFSFVREAMQKERGRTERHRERH